MPRPHLLISSTLSSIRHELLQRDVNQNSRLVLVPGHIARRGWRKTAQKYFSGGCALPHFAMMDDWFIEAALASADRPLRFITPAQRRLVLRALLNSLKPQLNDLQKLVDSNQFLQQIDRWMGNLFEANVTRWPDNGGAWVGDLQIVLQNYDSWKQRQDGELWDTEFAPRLFAESADNYPALSQQIVVEAAVTLSPNHREGLKNVISVCDSVMVTLVAPGIGDHCQTWPELLKFAQGSLLENTLNFWQEQDAEVEILPSENWIYTDRLNDLNGLAESRRKIYPTSVFKAHTPRNELRQIAISIRKKAENVHEAAKCAVLLNNSSRYSDVLKSTFTEYGLPLRRSPKQSLSASPLVQKFLQLLNLPNQHWKASALADVFSGGALAFVFDNHRLDVRNIEKAAALLRQHTLNDLDEISGLLKSTFIRDLDIENTQKDIKAIELLQQRLDEIRDATSHQDWLKLVAQFWSEVTVHWDDEKSDTAKIAQQQISDVKFALEKLKQSATSWQKYFREDSAMWQSQLNLVLSDTNVSSEVGTRSGVGAASPRQLLQDVPEIIYWPGMSEADYPNISQSALQSRHQKMMRELCPHLPSPTAQSIYWLALALAEAKEICFYRPTFCEDHPISMSVLLEEFAVKKGDEKDAEENRIEEKDLTSAPETSIAQKYFSLSQWRQDVAIAALRGDVAALQNDSLPKAVHQMFVKRTGTALNYFDGSFGEGSAELMKAIMQKSGHPLTLSASSLQSYAECGLKYFFQKVLLLEDRPDHELLLQKNETGSLIHTILQKFYAEFPHLLKARHQGEAWELLVRLARQEVARLPISQVLQKVELRRLIGDGKDAPRGTLGKYLLSEVELRQNWGDSDFAQPMQPFGLSSLPLPKGLQRPYEGTFTLEMDGVRLEGKLDRLDVNADGSAVMAVDYKTGNVPVSKNAPDGVSFQMPLYIWALAELFDKQQLHTGGIFYSLTDFKYLGGISQRGVLKEKLKKDGEKKAPTNYSARSLDANEWGDFMAALSRQIKTIHYLIEQGQFPISVREAAAAKCQWCDFKNICYRNEELQMERQSALTGEEPIYTEGLTTKMEWSKQEVNMDEAE